MLWQQKGKINLSLPQHNTNNCPTKLRLNAIIEDFLPPEDQEGQELEIFEKQDEENNFQVEEWRNSFQVYLDLESFS